MEIVEAHEPSDITRVILWALPRSVSTSFLKCMTTMPNSEVWFEPFWMARAYSNYGKPNRREERIRVLRELWGAKEAHPSTFGTKVSGINILLTCFYITGTLWLHL